MGSDNRVTGVMSSRVIVWKSERGSKTRSGQDGGHQRAFEPKAYASNNKSRCPVEFYKAFRSHRSETMLEPDAPFYLAINHRRKPNDKVWYLDRPLGKNEIGKFLKDAFATAKLDDTTTRRLLITPLGRPVLDDSLEQTFSQTSLHS